MLDNNWRTWQVYKDGWTGTRRLCEHRSSISTWKQIADMFVFFMEEFSHNWYELRCGINRQFIRYKTGLVACDFEEYRGIWSSVVNDKVATVNEAFLLPRQGPRCKLPPWWNENGSCGSLWLALDGHLIDVFDVKKKVYVALLLIPSLFLDRYYGKNQTSQVVSHNLYPGSVSPDLYNQIIYHKKIGLISSS